MIFIKKGNPISVLHANKSDLSKECLEPQSFESEFNQALFYGNKDQAKQFLDLFEQKSGNTTQIPSGIKKNLLRKLWGNFHLKYSSEQSDEYQKDFHSLEFYFLNDASEPCRILLMYRIKDLEWCFCLHKNIDKNIHQQQLILKTTQPFDKHFSKSAEDLFSENEINSSMLFNLLDAGAKEKSINHSYFLKFACLLKPFDILNNTLRDPVPSNIDQLKIAANNFALESLLENKINVSSELLMDCLESHSVLEEEFLKLKDSALYNSLTVKMIVAFFESKTLAQNRHLVEKSAEFQQYQVVLNNTKQINLFLALRLYDFSVEQCLEILANELFYISLGYLADLQLLRNVKEQFSKPQKIAQLLKIAKLTDEDTKKIALLFWFENSFDDTALNAFILAAASYSMMSKTLFNLYLQCPSPQRISQLRHMVDDPKLHLKESIRFNFLQGMCNRLSHEQALQTFNLAELSLIFEVMQILKVNDMAKPSYISQILDPEKNRILCSQIKAVANKNSLQCKSTIQGIFSLVNANHFDDSIIKKRKNSEWHEIYKTVFCYQQLSKLKVIPEILEWSLNAYKDARRFRDIVFEIEWECCKISRMMCNFPDQKVRQDWHNRQKDYRRQLYKLSYETLSAPLDNKQDKIKNAKIQIPALERALLSTLKTTKRDNQLWETIKHVLSFISNLLIACLTFGVAPFEQYRRTGQCSFFKLNFYESAICRIDNKLVSKLES